MKKRVITIVVCLSLLLIISVAYVPFYLRNKEMSSLIQQGNDLVKKVEAYKKEHHKIPVYLEDMKLNLPDDYPLYYNTTKDSGNYIISFATGSWFGSGFFSHKAYHSDLKQWIDSN